MKEQRTSGRLRRGLTAVLGGLVLLFGIITIPYPGPGWLIVFAGLGILSTEFEWAKNLLLYAREKYDRWQDWIGAQSMAVKVLFWCLTTIVVVATIYLLNGYGILNELLRLDQDWLASPFVRN